MKISPKSISPLARFITGDIEQTPYLTGIKLVELFNEHGSDDVYKYGEGTFVDYYGLTPQEERQSNIQKFQDPDSGVRFFVGTTQTGGYGITLTAASTMIYYSNGYDLEKRQQSEARIDRIGQEKPMTYIDIICENTVDTRIVKALRKKVDIATQIMGEELKEWI